MSKISWMNNRQVNYKGKLMTVTGAVEHRFDLICEHS